MISAPRSDFVLGAFDRMDERLVAAGDEEEQALARPAEGRRQLGAILDREPARGARAGIDQAPVAGSQPRLDRDRRILHGGAGAADRCDGRKLALDQRVEDFRWLPGVEPGVALADGFGFHGGGEPELEERRI